MGQKAKTFYAIDSPFFLFMEGLGGFATKKSDEEDCFEAFSPGGTC